MQQPLLGMCLLFMESPTVTAILLHHFKNIQRDEKITIFVPILRLHK